MSRSYKHNPICTDRKHGAKWWKRQANHRVRRTFDVSKGKGYRKVYNSWEIHDYICRESKADAIAWYRKVISDTYRWKEYWINDYPTLEDYLNKCWAHNFFRK